MTRLHRLRSVAIGIAGVATFLVAWWVVAQAQVWSPLFVPHPLDVWHQLLLTTTVHNGQRGVSGYLLQEHLLASVRRIALGAAIGVAGGVAIGLALGLVPTLRAALGPALTFLRILPPLAYLYLLVIWFGIAEAPKVWVLLIAALPVVAVATADAVHNVAEDYRNAARSLGARRWELPWRVILPAALPEILTGVRLAVGVAYTSMVAAETINGVPGIGGMIRDAQRYNNTDVVVLGILVIGLSGLLIDASLQLLQRRLAPWRGRV